MLQAIADTPVAVIDFETTGLNAGIDRVVEVSVVRQDPGQEPHLTLNTLVNPRRRMAATEIHGITDQDVRDAPRFEEVATSFVQAIGGAVVASYNVYFDLRFLEDELARVGIHDAPPHLCLMYLRPLLGLGPKCSLDVACKEHGIRRTIAHQAAVDAESGAELWRLYLTRMRTERIRNFSDLQGRSSYKFLDSLSNDPLRSVSGDTRSTHLKPRAVPTQDQPATTSHDAWRSYFEALKVVLSDDQITDDECESMVQLRRELGLADPELRAIHAKAFADLLSLTTRDRVLDDGEAAQIRRLHGNLVRLGWAPGT